MLSQNKKIDGDETNTPINVEIARSLNFLMEQSNVSAAKLAKETNIAPSTISRLLSAYIEDPKASILTTLSSYFSVSLDQLVGRSPVNKPKISVDYLSIPILTWNECTNYKLTEDLDIQRDWIQVKTPVARNAFGLRSKPYHAPDIPFGSIFVVDPTLEVCEGDMVIVYTKDTSEAKVRRILGNGKKIIFSHINSNVDEEYDYEILGIISETIFTYKYREKN